MPLYKANGIVLHRLNLGETDRILTLLTREAGKVSAVAKGSRRVPSKLSGATELFTHSRLLLATGKSLDIVSQCEIRESFPPLRVDLELLARATYLCELTDRFVEEREPNVEVFDLLLSALYLLQRVPDRPDIIVHAFELRLLAERGWTPALERCAKCGGPVERGRVGFSPSLGGALCRSDRYGADDAIALSYEGLRAMGDLLHAEPADLIGAVHSVQAMREVGKCLRWYVRYRSERDLRSAEFVERLRIAAAQEAKIPGSAKPHAAPAG